MFKHKRKNTGHADEHAKYITEANSSEHQSSASRQHEQDHDQTLSYHGNEAHIFKDKVL